MREVIVLGCTGSVGTQALEVLAERTAEFDVVALAAGGRQPKLLAEQVLAHRPRLVGITQATAAQDLQLALYAEVARRGWSEGKLTLPKLIAGPDAATEVAGAAADVVLNAITGSAGLRPTLATLAAGTTLALANKESLVIGGALVVDAAAPGQLVAVDSEHSALAQALRAGRAAEVDRLIITASGGPFRGWTREQMRVATPAQALAHPTWDMGRVITTNSATMVNKALEVLEAHLLYDVPLDRIDVVVHPQSMIHSMVQFVDGSTLAQCSPPDMKLPIGLALSWPARMPGVARACDWSKATSWTFEPLDEVAFPAVALGKRAGRAGGTATAVYNAANEVAVDAFHEGRIDFTDIVDVVAEVLEDELGPTCRNRPRIGVGSAATARSGADVGSSVADRAAAVTDRSLTVDAVLAADRTARERAGAACAARSGQDLGGRR